MSDNALVVGPDEDDEQKSIALELLLEAWDEAIDRGCTPETVATSALYAALADMIDTFGEESIAKMADALPDRIRRGDFSMRDGDLH